MVDPGIIKEWISKADEDFEIQEKFQSVRL